MKRDIFLINKGDKGLTKYIHSIDINTNITEVRVVDNNIILIIDSLNNISNRWINSIYYFIELQFLNGAPVRLLTKLVREVIFNELYDTI